MCAAASAANNQTNVLTHYGLQSSSSTDRRSTELGAARGHVLRTFDVGSRLYQVGDHSEEAILESQNVQLGPTEDAGDLRLVGVVVCWSAIVVLDLLLHCCVG